MVKFKQQFLHIYRFCLKIVELI